MGHVRMKTTTHTNVQVPFTTRLLSKVMVLIGWQMPRYLWTDSQGEFPISVLFLLFGFLPQLVLYRSHGYLETVDRENNASSCSGSTMTEFFMEPIQNRCYHFL